MTKIDDGWAAETAHDDYVYPGTRFAQNGFVTGHGMGLSLRDWFAGQVISGLMANPNVHGILRESGHGATAGEAAALLSFGYADAMLAARKRGAA